MKTQTPLLALAAAAVLASCAHEMHVSTDPRLGTISGRWVNTNGVALQINRDGSFVSDVNENGTVSLTKGRVVVEEKTIRFQNTSSNEPGCATASGLYKYALDRNTLFLRPISDSCAKRRFRFSNIWRRP